MTERNFKIILVIPTYNEAENIKNLISDIFLQNSKFEILIVDDNSPDGTWRLVEELSVKDSRIHLLKRGKKEGLGAAYKAGFVWAIRNEYDIIFQMDADFSHDPGYLNNIKEAISSCDVVIGSRYVKGGKIIGWGLRRTLLSALGNFYARCITNVPLRDLTSGFNCWRREVLEDINLYSVKAEGYSFLLELKYRAHRSGFKMFEYPITFKDRVNGKSKLNGSIIREAIIRCWTLRIDSLISDLRSKKNRILKKTRPDTNYRW